MCMLVENWAKERNMVDLNSKEFRIYLICFVSKYPEKTTPDMWVVFAFLTQPIIEC